MDRPLARLTELTDGVEALLDRSSRPAGARLGRSIRHYLERDRALAAEPRLRQHWRARAT